MAGWETTHHNKYLIVLTLFFIFSIIQKEETKLLTALLTTLKLLN